MPFTIQHPVSGLFWNTDADSKIVLAPKGAKYERVDQLIQNVDSGLYVYASPLEERGMHGALVLFEWDIQEDGTITSPYIEDALASLGSAKWVITVEKDDDDVPVNRASALIEEALNAKSESVPEPEPLAPVSEETEDEVPDAHE
jgi:hypothetical protein